MTPQDKTAQRQLLAVAIEHLFGGTDGLDPAESAMQALSAACEGDLTCWDRLTQMGTQVYDARTASGRATPKLGSALAALSSMRTRLGDGVQLGPPVWAEVVEAIAEELATEDLERGPQRHARLSRALRSVLRAHRRDSTARDVESVDDVSHDPWSWVALTATR